MHKAIEINVEKLVELQEMGISYRCLAERFGRSTRTIHNMVGEYKRKKAREDERNN